MSNDNSGQFISLSLLGSLKYSPCIFKIFSSNFVTWPPRLHAGRIIFGSFGDSYWWTMHLICGRMTSTILGKHWWFNVLLYVIFCTIYLHLHFNISKIIILFPICKSGKDITTKWWVKVGGNVMESSIILHNVKHIFVERSCCFQCIFPISTQVLQYTLSLEISFPFVESYERGEFSCAICWRDILCIVYLVCIDDTT